MTVSVKCYLMHPTACLRLGSKFTVISSLMVIVKNSDQYVPVKKHETQMQGVYYSPYNLHYLVCSTTVVYTPFQIVNNLHFGTEGVCYKFVKPCYKRLYKYKYN
jgi:hypothetical protein